MLISNEIAKRVKVLFILIVVLVLLGGPVFPVVSAHRASESIPARQAFDAKIKDFLLKTIILTSIFSLSEIFFVCQIRDNTLYYEKN